MFEPQQLQLGNPGSLPAPLGVTGCTLDYHSINHLVPNTLFFSQYAAHSVAVCGNQWDSV
jgi:hypothetical protein